MQSEPGAARGLPLPGPCRAGGGCADQPGCHLPQVLPPALELLPTPPDLLGWAVVAVLPRSRPHTWGPQGPCSHVLTQLLPLPRWDSGLATRESPRELGTAPHPGRGHSSGGIPVHKARATAGHPPCLSLSVGQQPQGVSAHSAGHQGIRTGPFGSESSCSGKGAGQGCTPGTQQHRLPTGPAAVRHRPLSLVTSPGTVPDIK